MNEEKKSIFDVFRNFCNVFARQVLVINKFL